VGLQPEDATFTIPKAPVRRRIHGIHAFNVLRCGEYLFMPSLSALKWPAHFKGGLWTNLFTIAASTNAGTCSVVNM
jgi:hypothetical protein